MMAVILQILRKVFTDHPTGIIFDQIGRNLSGNTLKKESKRDILL